MAGKHRRGYERQLASVRFLELIPSDVRTLLIPSHLIPDLQRVPWIGPSATGWSASSVGLGVNALSTWLRIGRESRDQSLVVGFLDQVSGEGSMRARRNSSVCQRLSGLRKAGPSTWKSDGVAQMSEKRATARLSFLL